MGRQRIARVRRQYNQWVGNQTLEDYALRFTAKGARRWSLFRVANTALGAASFLACEAIGGSLTLDFGFTNVMLAIAAVSVLIFLTGLPIAYYAVKHGVDIDLLTRGAGFGYLGSTITSLIYASFTFLLFAVEAVIMALALEMCFGIPLPAGYVICAVVVIPIVAYGIRFISGMQLWTQPIWLGLQVAPLVYIALSDSPAIDRWIAFSGRAEGPAGGFDIFLFGAAASILLSLLPQIGEQVDYLRFMPGQGPATESRTKRFAWWSALLITGPGWIFIGAGKLIAGSFLAVLALGHGVPVEHAAEPTQIYRVAFEQLSLSPRMAVVLTGIFVITCQLKINVTNMYAGSIAWSNFFSRLTHSHPGRVVWLIFNVILALLLMELGVFGAIEKILGLYSNLAVAWIGALVADLIINKPLGLSPPTIEFRRAHLYDVNPVGIGAMLASVLVSTAAFFGLFGALAQALAPFIGLFVALVAAPAIAYLTAGRYYIARAPRTDWNGQAEIACCICEHVFEREDMSFCPAYDGPICSLCCTLDARCHDMCKTDSRFGEQVRLSLAHILPQRIAVSLNSRLGHFAGTFLLFNLVTACALLLIGVFETNVATGAADAAVIRATLLSVYFALFFISGVGTWLMVLAQESRHVAEEETDRQTQMLTHEIEAHERTSDQLQKAKTAAESANLAKSRYLVGMSHEIRSPLNAIFGYAQVMARDKEVPPRRKEAIHVIRRSAEHLSTLVDGLLDIAKIEAGRLHLTRDLIATESFFGEIADMFRIQARAKGIGFDLDLPSQLPAFIHADEKRLRQIVINLLSNAIKYTEQGQVALRLRYRGQVCEIEVTDTGIGILAEDMTRIFQPFERGSLAVSGGPPGTGLGLTITKLLCEVMGGEIVVESRPGQGSAFRVRLFLSEAASPVAPIRPLRRITGYRGRRLTVVAADDDLAQLELLREILEPLDFQLSCVSDGIACLSLARQLKPDLLLLDLSMPGMGGWEVARRLRHIGDEEAAIIVISANADERPAEREPDADHDAFIAKPMDVDLLLDWIRRLLDIDWIYDLAEPGAPQIQPQSISHAAMPIIAPLRRHIDDLHQLGRIGYIRGIEAKLTELEESDSSQAAFFQRLRELTRNFDLKQYMTILETMRGRDG